MTQEFVALKNAGTKEHTQISIHNLNCESVNTHHGQTENMISLVPTYKFIIYINQID